MNRRAAGFWVGLGLALLAIAVVTGGRTEEGDPLDPASTQPLGTHGLVAFLDEFGVEISRGLPNASVARTLVLADRLQPQQRAELEDWVSAGGVLIIVDPGSSLTPAFGTATLDDSGAISSSDCTIEALRGLTIEAGTFLRYDATDADQFCFADDGGTYLHEVNVGEGRIISLGGGLALTNGQLDQGDNAVLAAELLVTDERSTVTVLYEPLFTAGSRSLSDLIPSRAKWAGWQLLVAAGVFLLWRVRRFGSPVPEPQPVELPASLLVRATAELRRRSRGWEPASAELRTELTRRLRRDLKLAPDLPPSALIEHVASELSIDVELVARAVQGQPAAGGAELSALVADIDGLNEALDRRAATETELLPTGDNS